MGCSPRSEQRLEGGPLGLFLLLLRFLKHTPRSVRGSFPTANALRAVSWLSDDTVTAICCVFHTYCLLDSSMRFDSSDTVYIVFLDRSKVHSHCP